MVRLNINLKMKKTWCFLVTKEITLKEHGMSLLMLGGFLIMLRYFFLRFIKVSLWGW